MRFLEGKTEMKTSDSRKKSPYRPITNGNAGIAFQIKVPGGLEALVNFL